MKSPEEIKKGLECCGKGNSCRGHCPYDGRSSGIMECTSKISRDALAYIQQLEARVPRWIPVEERLPDDGKNVLVYMTNAIGWWTMGLDWMDEQGWVTYPDSDWRKVTHWMPLPEPPKEDQP